MDNVIVNFTPTGVLPQKKDTIHVPISIEEIIEDVRLAYNLGISMVHVHAREPESGEPSYRKEIYGEIIAGIREFAPDLIICISTSGRIFNTFDKRAEALSLEGVLKPDMASLTLSSLNFNQRASVNEPETIFLLAETMIEKGIKPEIEIFDLGMANYMKYMVRKGVLKPPYYANLILGNIACAQTNFSHIGCLLQDVPEGTLISMGGVGDAQLSVNSLAIAFGYGVRVGIEDNYWYDQTRAHKATNKELLKRVISIVKANEKTVMSPTELRVRLGLKGGFGEYGV